MKLTHEIWITLSKYWIQILLLCEHSQNVPHDKQNTVPQYSKTITMEIIPLLINF
jgi:hypothetical protein